VVVGKHGHTVVERNQLRRRLRELVRQSIIPDCRSVDVVLRTLPSAYGADFKELSGEVNEIKTKIMKYTLV
jgi:ribonuclease P protein component